MSFRVKQPLQLAAPSLWSTNQPPSTSRQYFSAYCWWHLYHFVSAVQLNNFTLFSLLLTYLYFSSFYLAPKQTFTAQLIKLTTNQGVHVWWSRSSGQSVSSEENPRLILRLEVPECNVPLSVQDDSLLADPHNRHTSTSLNPNYCIGWDKVRFWTYPCNLESCQPIIL